MITLTLCTRVQHTHQQEASALYSPAQALRCSVGLESNQVFMNTIKIIATSCSEHF